jgi:hypothetical protein
MTAGCNEIGHVGVEVFAAAGAVVLRVENDAVAGASCEGIAEIVEDASGAAIAIGAMATSRTRAAAVVAVETADLGFGQIRDAVDAHGGIGSVFSGSWHVVSPGRGLPGDTHDTSVLFTDPAR